MKAVFNRTLTGMFKPVSMIIYLVLSLVGVLLIGVNSFYEAGTELSIEVQRINVIDSFTLLVFIWLAGILLMLLIATVGSGLFATEESEGTMRILLAKPVSRNSVILGKIFGLITGSFIYMLTGLIISISLYSIMTSVDGDVFKVLVNKLPSFICYGLFIILLFTGVTALLSSIFKKRVPAIIILTVFTLLTFGVLPIARSIMTAFRVYEKYGIYVVDTNYHMGSIYTTMLEGTGEFNPSPMGQTIIGMFSGIYVESIPDSDIVSNQYYFMGSVKKSSFINSFVIIFIYSSISIASYILCYIRMSKKDIT